MAHRLLTYSVGGQETSCYRTRRPLKAFTHRQRAQALWGAVGLFVLAGCTRPVHPRPDAAVVACREGMAKLSREDALVALGRACKDLYVEPGCRDAWAGLDQHPAAARAKFIIDSCRDAYCPKLKGDPKPTLCSDPDLPDASFERVLLWNELNQAILVRDLGARRSARLISELSIIEALDPAPP